MQAPEKHKTTAPRRNPVDFGLFYQDRDPRDAERKRREEGSFTVTHSDWGVPRVGKASATERYFRAVALTSKDRLRWRRMIEHANNLAQERGMTREEFYSKALIGLIEALENDKLAEELSEIYGTETDDQQKEFLRQARDYRRRRLSAG
jgi:hypothetical protein